ncbi:hypothetical protein NLJ89_g7325 [Agrocybe chaxingu]|uniref:Uncharacterized protein n=1 Tax=Agrocybe chaxingu TaxID=84603 RepID=A0A9W8JUS7_9AGAR|nr:hypothetical protein NLJ89_g7325 [Agrocybe chaxingu]
MATVSSNRPGSSKNTALYIAIPVVVIVCLTAFMVACRCKRNLRTPQARIPPKEPALQYYERQQYTSNVPGPPDVLPPPRSRLDMPVASPSALSQYPAFPIPMTALPHADNQPASPDFPVVLTVASLQEPDRTAPIPTSLLERMREVQRLMMEIHKLEGRPGATQEEEGTNRQRIRELQQRITELSERESDNRVDDTTGPSPMTPAIREPPPAYAFASSSTA